MSEAAAPAPGGPVPWSKRLLSALAVSLPLLVFLGWAYARGTYADAEERNPADSAAGPVRQLYQTPDGHKHVRCSIVIDAPAKEAWGVITDYEHFREIFARLTEASFARRPAGRRELTGALRSRLWGTYEFTTVVRHEESADRFVASWDQPGGDLQVNRGRWEVRALGADRCLLVLMLEASVAKAPDFVLRDVLLGRVKPVLAALRDRTMAKQAK